ncbi:uncharacterized protein BKA78DRAFT_300602 [Phyllosticta capitalensis]|uniref:uncharacterized protein n=1 Tax=Phyllosticta capitalensis TaxID=121624 RepID=UPI0031319D9F
MAQNHSFSSRPKLSCIIRPDGRHATEKARPADGHGIVCQPEPTPTDPAMADEIEINPSNKPVAAAAPSVDRMLARSCRATEANLDGAVCAPPVVRFSKRLPPWLQLDGSDATDFKTKDTSTKHVAVSRARRFSLLPAL